jgi:ureidoglycolate dehydrogenase (NAD+)
MASQLKIEPGVLRDYVRELFQARGVSEEHAATVAEVLVWANLRGVDSHGISRVPRYLELLDSGEANPAPSIQVQSAKAAFAVIDADRAPGPVALSLAADEAIKRAKESGIGLVSVRRTVHTGAIGYYTNRIAEAGLIGLGMVAGMPNMAYTGASGASVATSPLSIAVPGTGKFPTVLLDMATAVIALGKIAQYKKAGKELPEGAAVSADGTPTTDPSIAKIPLPVGGAKGAGLSLMFELLTSVLVGEPVLPGFHDGRPGGREHRQNASLIAIDPSAVAPFGSFAQDVDATIETVRSLPLADGYERVILPGQRGAETFEERTRGGIPVPESLWKQLNDAAAASGVPSPLVPAG